MLILGEKEQDAGTVSIRKHKEGDKGSATVDEFLKSITADINKLSTN